MKVIEERGKTWLKKLNIQKTKIMASSPITSWQTDGETMGTVTDFIFLGSKITADGDCSHEIKRRLLLGKKAMTNLGSTVKSRHNTLPTSLCSQRYSFSSSHVWMWKLDYKESWALKNWCLQTAALEKTLDSPLDSQIKQDNPKGNQPWILTGRTDAEDEAPILWLNTEYWSEELTYWKRSWCWERLKAGGEGASEDEMVGCRYQLNGHKFEQALGVGDGQGSLACWSPRDRSQTQLRDWTERYLHTSVYLKRSRIYRDV